MVCTICAQEITSIKLERADAKNFTQIHFYYTSYTESGAYGGNAFIDDVKVFENGRQEHVWGQDESHHVPSRLSIIIDSSGSMVQKMATVIDAVKNLIGMRMIMTGFRSLILILR
ncbi:MAG: hypothetical protein JXB26_09405 [Candidatus Aminicenantes bacterium]|nr:hypothetical protein [Candidatus Aminicenantes bacterium]